MTATEHGIAQRSTHGVEDIECKIAVWINDGDPLSPTDVAHRQIEQKGALAATGFADDVDVALALLTRERDVSAAGGCRNGNSLGLHNVASASGENLNSAHTVELTFAVRAFRSLWEMIENAAHRATYGGV